MGDLVTGSRPPVPKEYESPSHPLYLHPSDQPGVMLVSLPLTGDNYTTWSRAIVMALSAKNKVGLIDGSILKPAKTDSLFNQWIRCNNMVTSWLFNSLSKDPAASVIYSESAQAMWKDLKERFSQTNAPHLFQIEREIHDLTQDTMSVGTYFTKLKGMWDELNALSPTPSCSCGAMTESNTNGQRNFKNTDKKKGGTRDRPTCEHCNWVGHTMDKCYSLHGYPPGHRLYKATSSATANQAVHSAIEKQHSGTNSFPFTQEQCRQILALIPKSPHVANQAGSNVSISNLSGPTLEDDDWDG
ncbi:hypothetical protein RHSIM_Rhsim01G0079100 [Rhododendron simsii]|uniref:Retrotransposon Copia-like N-terminal domain-containing protein n=1 Tax=Rhododendron simsii TaxID=118357 RepID=A0A834HH82_RHOSS|nr:hypothetical protein RHSIM_Rhsim01G0079100 [Rhododendron simsii]